MFGCGFYTVSAMQNSNQVGDHDTKSSVVSGLICFSLGFLDVEYLENHKCGATFED